MTLPPYLIGPRSARWKVNGRLKDEERKVRLVDPAGEVGLYRESGGLNRRTSMQGWYNYANPMEAAVCMTT